MTKALWISDLHYAFDGDVLDHDPRARLASAIGHINTHHRDADYCFITGDMVNRGSREDYAGLRARLDQLEIPYFPMMGNHDDRALLREFLPLPANVMDDFIQYEITTPNEVFLCLDTHMVGSDAGEFCEQRSQWLLSALEAAGSKPTYLLLHHPPMALGLPMQDQDRMVEGEAFLDLIGAFSNVSYLFIGHVHRPISGVVHNIPFTTIRSVLYQAPPPQPPWTWEGFQPALEAPCIGVLELNRSNLNLNFDQFCSAEFGVN